MATVKASTTCQSRRSDECLASTQEELEAVKKQLKDAVSQIEQEEDSNSSNDYRLCPLYMNNVWGFCQRDLNRVLESTIRRVIWAAEVTLWPCDPRELHH